MEKAWVKIITVTGSVGVVGLLISLLINHIFNEKIVDTLGSEKTFFILVVIVCGLLVALIVAIMTPKPAPQTTSPSEPSKKVDIKYNNGSTHNGDNKF